jgi:hypothetical protein
MLAHTSLSMPRSLKDEFQYYLDHQAEMVAKYNGKHIVLKDGVVVGAYDTELEAVTATQKVHALGTFLVQKVEPGNAAYTQTFHSRVAFATENA